MSYELLQDMFYAAPELWYILGAAFAALLAFLMYNGVKILKLRQKNYFLNRDRERYAETLYASPLFIPTKKSMIRAKPSRKDVRAVSR